MSSLSQRTAYRVTKSLKPQLLPVISVRYRTYNCVTQTNTIQHITQYNNIHTTTQRYNNTTNALQQQYKTLLISEHNDPCPYITVTINRENVHNAFNDTVINEITTVFNYIHQQHKSHTLNARAVILTGAGTKSFSSGADLNWMKSMIQYTYEQNKRDSEAMFDMFNVISTCPVPTIARINGTALGGGTGLAAVTDINVCVESAIFGLTEVRLGLAPAVISKWVIDKIGRSYASLYWLTGERFSADTAKQIGLIQHVTNDISAMDTYIYTVLKQIGNSSPQAVSETKKLIQYVASQNDYESCKHYCTDLIATLRVSDEGQEGLNAFFQKRKPNWIPSK